MFPLEVTIYHAFLCGILQPRAPSSLYCTCVQIKIKCFLSLSLSLAGRIEKVTPLCRSSILGIQTQDNIKKKVWPHGGTQAASGSTSLWEDVGWPSLLLCPLNRMLLCRAQNAHCIQQLTQWTCLLPRLPVTYTSPCLSRVNSISSLLCFSYFLRSL